MIKGNTNIVEFEARAWANQGLHYVLSWLAALSGGAPAAALQNLDSLQSWLHNGVSASPLTSGEQKHDPSSLED